MTPAALLLSLLLAAPPPVQVRAETDRATVPLGTTFRFRIDIERAPDVKAAFPSFPPPDAAFAVSASGREGPETLPGGRIREARWYELDPYGAGAIRLDPLDVPWQAPDGSADTARTPEILVEVTEAAGGDPLAALKGPKDPVDVPVPPFPWNTAALGAAAGALVVVLLVRRLRLPRPPPPPPDPAEVALAALAAIEAACAPTAAGMKAHHVRVSDIVREYLEGRFDLRAPKRTTEEFLSDAATAAALSEAHRALLADFLSRCDRVKFARWQPEPDDAIEVLAAARRLVEETRTRPEGTK